MNRDFIFNGKDGLITTVIEFFFASIYPKEHFDKIVSICLTHPNPFKNRNPILVKMGRFGIHDFLYYHSKKFGDGPIDLHVIEELLRRFCYNNLLIRSELLLSIGPDCYEVNELFARYLLERNALENLAFDFPRLIQKYTNSVLHLTVENKLGDVSNGTGFLFAQKNMVLTNKHVVEEDANRLPRVLDCSGNQLPVRNIVTSDVDDLAIIELQEPFTANPFFPMPQVMVLDEIVTMGYPRIAFTKSALLVAHRGEINGVASLMAEGNGDRLIFSAKTAPGNSGGPLFNRAGLVVGIVTNDTNSEEARANNRAPYFTAIPITRMAAFVAEIMETNARILASKPPK